MPGQPSGGRDAHRAASGAAPVTKPANAIYSGAASDLALQTAEKVAATLMNMSQHLARGHNAGAQAHDAPDWEPMVLIDSVASTHLVPEGREVPWSKVSLPEPLELQTIDGCRIFRHKAALDAGELGMLPAVVVKRDAPTVLSLGQLGAEGGLRFE